MKSAYVFEQSQGKQKGASSDPDVMGEAQDVTAFQVDWGFPKTGDVRATSRDDLVRMLSKPLVEQHFSKAQIADLVDKVLARMQKRYEGIFLKGRFSLIKLLGPLEIRGALLCLGCGWVGRLRAPLDGPTCWCSRALDLLTPYLELGAPQRLTWLQRCFPLASGFQIK